MKKIRCLSLWLVILCMLVSSVAVYAEPEQDNEITDETTDDELVTEEEISQNELLPHEEGYIEDEIVDDGTSGTVVTESEDTEDSSSDIKETDNQEELSKYYESVVALTELGIYSFGKKDAQETVKRGEFAHILTDLLDIDTSNIKASALFWDVTESTEYASDIYAIAQLGVMNGMGDGTFRPSSEITYMQAVKTLICALGYDVIAKGQGGYPTGYIKCATDIKLLKSYNKNYENALTFKEAAPLLMLAAETEVFEAVGYGGNSVFYEGREDKLLLNVYHNIYKDKGYMTSNGITSIAAEHVESKEYVKIGSRVLYGADKKEVELIGCNTEYYYKEENGSYKLMYAWLDENRTEIVKLFADELLTDNSEFSKTCVAANINGRTRKYKVDVYADFIYNGSVDETFSKNSMKIENGTLTLIDADGDGDFEVVKAECFEDVIVTNNYPERKTVVSQIAPNDYITIEYEKYDYVVFEDADGEDIDPSAITANNVLSVFRSKDKSKIRFVICIKSAEIMPQIISTEDGDTQIEYDDKVVHLAKTYKNLMKEKPSLYRMPVIGNTYTTLFNFEGDVVMMTESRGKSQYAYLMGIARCEGLKANEIEMKLHLESDDTAVVRANEKITVDGVKKTPAINLLSDERIVNNGQVKPQLVKVTINGKGILTEIEIDNEAPADDDIYGFDLEKFSLDWATTGTIGYYSSSGNRAVNGKYCLTMDTKIFVVCNKNTKLETTYEEEVQVVSYSTYSSRYGSTPVKLYDANESWEVGAAVVSDTYGYALRTFTVDNSAVVIDEYGEEKTRITGWYTQEYITFRERNMGILSNAVKVHYPDGMIKKGDVFEIMIDVNEEINQARLLYSPARDTDPDYCFVNLANAAGTINSYYVYMLGYPTVVNENRVGMYCKENRNYTPIAETTKQTTSDETFWITPVGSSVVVLEYDCLTKELKMIKANEIPVSAELTATGYQNFDTNTKIFMKRSKGIAYDIMIMTNCNSR